MKIKHYITSILQESDSIIIAGLGKFYTQYKSASFDESTRLLSPPGISIFFDKNITTDSGTLQSYISEKENMNSDDAYALITDFVEHTKAMLRKGEKITFDGIGYLYAQEDDLFFEEKLDTHFSVRSYGLENVHIPQIKHKKEVDFEISEIEIKELPLVKARTGLKISLTILPVLILICIGFTQLEMGNKYGLLIKQYEQNWLQAILSPSTKKEKVATPVVDEKVAIQSPLANILHNSFPDSTSVKRNIKQVQPEIGTGQTLFHLVSASYRSHTNLKQVIQKLKDKGYNPIALPEKGGWIKLSIRQFTTLDDAIVATEAYNSQNQANPVWIFVAK